MTSYKSEFNKHSMTFVKGVFLSFCARNVLSTCYIGNFEVASQGKIMGKISSAVCVFECVSSLKSEISPVFNISLHFIIAFPAIFNKGTNNSA